jgi:UDP-N-acetyl-D-galactosamine dehydrogenase
MGKKVARECLRLLEQGTRRPERVTVLGLTFKENVPDIRNSKVVDIVRELSASGISVQVSDPIADPAHARREYGIELIASKDLQPAEAVVLAVAHDAYKAGWPLILPLLSGGQGVVVDVKARLDRSNVPAGVTLWRM